MCLQFTILTFQQQQCWIETVELKTYSMCLYLYWLGVSKNLVMYGLCLIREQLLLLFWYAYNIKSYLEYKKIVRIISIVYGKSIVNRIREFSFHFSLNIINRKSKNSSEASKSYEFVFESLIRLFYLNFCEFLLLKKKNSNFECWFLKNISIS